MTQSLSGAHMSFRGIPDDACCVVRALMFVFSPCLTRICPIKCPQSLALTLYFTVINLTKQVSQEQTVIYNDGLGTVG